MRNVYKIGIPVCHLPNTRQPCQASPKYTIWVAFCWWVCKCSSLSSFGALSLFRRSLSLARSLSFAHTQIFSVSFSLSCPPLLLRVFISILSLHFGFEKVFFFQTPFLFAGARCMARGLVWGHIRRRRSMRCYKLPRIEWSTSFKWVLPTVEKSTFDDHDSVRICRPEWRTWWSSFRHSTCV